MAELAVRVVERNQSNKWVLEVLDVVSGDRARRRASAPEHHHQYRQHPAHGVSLSLFAYRYHQAVGTKSITPGRFRRESSIRHHALDIATA